MNIVNFSTMSSNILGKKYHNTSKKILHLSKVYFELWVTSYEL